MAVSILSYDVNQYNSLPELNVAKEDFDNRQLLDIILTDIANMFVEYQVHEDLGLILLHNHFLLEPNEMLVNFNSVAVPWSNKIDVKELENVDASAWRFTEDGLIPYEFSYARGKVALGSTRIQSFLAALSALLHQFDLINIFGICMLDGSIDRKATMEFASGRANITLPVDVVPDDGTSVDAMWQFGFKDGHSQGDIVEPVVFGQCKQRCKGKPHASRHVSNT